MATETTNTEEIKTTATPMANTTLQETNEKRESSINSMYDSALAGQKATLEANYQQNLAAAERNKSQIADTYATQKNDAATTYERNRRNNNMQANANGLNTGAASQMQLGAANAAARSQTELNAAQAKAETDAAQGILDLQTAYKADIAKAESENDTARMAALIDEYGQAWDRTAEAAKTMASSGNFSGYALLYGQDTAAQMEKTWVLQNPDVAWAQNMITADEYFKLTGKWPNGYSTGSSSSSSSGGSSGKTLAQTIDENRAAGKETVTYNPDGTYKVQSYAR